jgi:NAD dependent epimerase/dehydratase family enzyme
MRKDTGSAPPGLPPISRAIVGEKSILVLEGQRQIPKRLQQMGFALRFPEAQGALSDLLK